MGRVGLCLTALLIATAASAQSSRPGPYVLDVRGVMAAAPSGPGFYPVVSSTTTLPGRGFGLDLGLHLYPLQLGPARLGVGVDAMRTRGSSSTPAVTGTTAATSTFASSAAMNVTSVSGQISFNFGTHDGWSYLSAGYGGLRTLSEVSNDVLGPIQHSDVSLKRKGAAINYGGGARWFIKERLATVFDVRFYRMGTEGSLPGGRVFSLSAGVSVR